MTTSHGKDGLVKVGANTVAETTQWSYTETIALADDSVQGDDWSTHKNGRKSWTGSITARFDSSDTNGQNALALGASVTVAFYPEGASPGDKYRTGTATVSSDTVTSSHEDINEVSFEVTGNGPLSSATVGA